MNHKFCSITGASKRKNSIMDDPIYLVPYRNIDRNLTQMKMLILFNLHLLKLLTQ